LDHWSTTSSNVVMSWVCGHPNLLTFECLDSSLSLYFLVYDFLCFFNLCINFMWLVSVSTLSQSLFFFFLNFRKTPRLFLSNCNKSIMDLFGFCNCSSGLQFQNQLTTITDGDYRIVFMCVMWRCWSILQWNCTTCWFSGLFGRFNFLLCSWFLLKVCII
jgi:hypothetical protein